MVDGITVGAGDTSQRHLWGKTTTKNRCVEHPGLPGVKVKLVIL